MTARPLTVAEERLLRMCLARADGQLEQPVSPSTVRKCLATIDALRAELVRQKPLKILPFPRQTDPAA